MPLTAGSVANNACLSCAGAGWKYVVHRLEPRAVPASCGAERILSRRSCLDCAGTGRAVVGS